MTSPIERRVAALERRNGTATCMKSEPITDEDGNVTGWRWFGRDNVHYIEVSDVSPDAETWHATMARLTSECAQPDKE